MGLSRIAKRPVSALAAAMTFWLVGLEAAAYPRGQPEAIRGNIAHVWHDDVGNTVFNFAQHESKSRLAMRAVERKRIINAARNNWCDEFSGITRRGKAKLFNVGLSNGNTGLLSRGRPGEQNRSTGSHPLPYLFTKLLLWRDYVYTQVSKYSKSDIYGGSYANIFHPGNNSNPRTLLIKGQIADRNFEYVNPWSVRFDQGSVSYVGRTLGSIGGLGSGFSGDRSVSHAFAHVAQLPIEQSKLETSDNHQPERKKSRSVFREPWLLALGFAGGIFGGWLLGWFTLRPRNRLKER